MLKTILRTRWVLLVTLLLGGMPPYSSRGYSIWEVGRVNGYILTHAMTKVFQPVYPVFKLIPLILVIAIFGYGNRTRKLFSLYVAISYVLSGLCQSLSVTQAYGTGICLAHLLLSFWIALLWLWEANHPGNDFSRRKPAFWKYWVFLPALLAFWEPVNPATGLPDFNFAYWLTSSAGLSFCMLTPLYLAILIVFYPTVNRAIFEVISLVGFAYALGNFYLAFFFNPSFWWVGILHVPLLILSLDGLCLSLGTPIDWVRAAHLLEAF